MKKSMMIVMALGLMVSGVNAAVIVTAITGDSDVLTDGTFVEAKNYTDGTPVTNVTVNGITFAADDASGWTYDISNAPGFSNPNITVRSWASQVFYPIGTQFGDMLNSAMWVGGSGNPTGVEMSLTLTGLTENTDYRMQLFTADTRDGFNHPFSVSVDGGATSSILTVDTAVRADVYFSTGALDTDALITVICEQDNIEGGFGGPSVASYALHSGVVPEPATMALLGLGGLVLARRRK